MIRRRRGGGDEGRRSGPPGEPRWWSPPDQAFVEGVTIARTAFGRGWGPTPMVNNAERLDPYGDDPASEALRAVRARRRLCALDEGQAWRRRRDGALAVLRLEVFEEPDASDHRAAWHEHGPACLDAVWRARWRERDQEPGWIEARWRAETDARLPAVDWLRVEDHTGVRDDPSAVVVYEHLTVWAGRAVAVLIVRHELGSDGEDAAMGAAAVLVPALERVPGATGGA